MKRIEVEPLPSFIVRRLTPVVYCYVTQDLINAHSDCIVKIRRKWKQICEQNKLTIRIHFPVIQPSKKTIDKYMKNSRSIFNCKQKGFYFDSKEYNVQYSRELQTIQYLRQVLYDFDFLTPGNFFDLPVAVMFFSVGQESGARSKFPSWAKRRIDQTSGSAAVYDEEKLETTLQTFMTRSVKSKVELNLDNARSEYLKKKDIQSYKQIADAETSSGNHRTAYNLISELLRMPNLPVELTPSCLLLKVELAIILGEISQDTVTDISNCIEFARSFEWRLLAILIHFWINFKSSKPTTAELENFLTYDTPITPIVKPFLIEQIAIFKGKQLPNLLIQAAEFHRMNKNDEHFIRCYWWAFLSIMNQDLYYSKNYLIHTIVATLFRENMETTKALTPYLGSLLKEINIQKAPITATYLALTEPEQVFECGFIKVSLFDVVYDSPSKGPPEYNDDEWFQAATRLFGFKFRNKFQNRKEFEANELCIGDVLEFKLKINSLCSEFEIGKATLNIQGNASSSSVNVGSSKEINLKMNIEGEGEIVVDGVTFIWAEKLKVISKFVKPFIVNVPSGAPRANLEVEWPIYEAVAGHPSKFSLTFTAITDLSHVTVLTHEKVQMIKPIVQEISGLYIVGDVKAGTVLNMNFRFASSNKGEDKVDTFIGYASENGNIGFKRYSSHLNVFPASSTNIPFYPCFHNANLNEMHDPSNFKLGMTIENRQKLNISVLTKAEPLKNIKCEIVGPVIGKSVHTVDLIPRGNNFTFSVIVLSCTDLILNITTKLGRYSTNISKYVEYLVKNQPKTYLY